MKIHIIYVGINGLMIGGFIMVKSVRLTPSQQEIVNKAVNKNQLYVDSIVMTEIAKKQMLVAEKGC